MEKPKYNLHLLFAPPSAGAFLNMSRLVSEACDNDLDLRSTSRPHITLARLTEVPSFRLEPLRLALQLGTPFVSPRNGRHILVPVFPVESDAWEALGRQLPPQVSIEPMAEWHVSIGYVAENPDAAIEAVRGLSEAEVWTQNLAVAEVTDHGGVGRVIRTSEAHEG